MHRSSNLEARVAVLEKELEEATTNLSHVKDDLLDSNCANKSLEADSAVINQVIIILYSFYKLLITQCFGSYSANSCPVLVAVTI